MRATRAMPLRFLLGGFAALAVVMTHQFAYTLAAPEPHHREALLEHTGHGGWPYVVAAALGLWVATLAGAVCSAERLGGGAFIYRTGTAFSRLLVLQVGGYAGLEAIERAFAGDLVMLPTESVFWIGLGLQVATALLAALVLGAFLRAVTWLTRRTRSPQRTRLSRIAPLLSVFLPPLPPATGGGSLRGPPRG